MLGSNGVEAALSVHITGGRFAQGRVPLTFLRDFASLNGLVKSLIEAKLRAENFPNRRIGLLPDLVLAGMSQGSVTLTFNADERNSSDESKEYYFDAIQTLPNTISEFLDEAPKPMELQSVLPRAARFFAALSRNLRDGGVIQIGTQLSSVTLDQKKCRFLAGVLSPDAVGEVIADTRLGTDFMDQIGSLFRLEDGWLDGRGEAPPEEELRTFAERFLEHYPLDLPVPAVCPTEDGGVELEWKRGIDFIATIDLKSQTVDWTGVTADGDRFELDLASPNTWEFISDSVRNAQRVRR